MGAKRTPIAIWFAVALLLVVALLSAYVAGYLLRSTAEVDPFSNDKLLIRDYPSAWEATIFRPATAIESTLTGRKVHVLPSSDGTRTLPDPKAPFAPFP